MFPAVARLAGEHQQTARLQQPGDFHAALRIGEFHHTERSEAERGDGLPETRYAVDMRRDTLAELVLSGYHQEKINSSTVSEYLGMKLKYLPKVKNYTR